MSIFLKKPNLLPSIGKNKKTLLQIHVSFVIEFPGKQNKIENLHQDFIIKHIHH